jgi:NADH:ubiquinone oxidoreductase subunit 6 (subunit J)
MSIFKILYYFFGSIAMTSALLTVTTPNPVHAVLFLIFCFLNVSAIMFMIDMEFIAVIFLIVYVGAISILFLFVVMMINIKMRDYIFFDSLKDTTFFSFLCLFLTAILYFSLFINDLEKLNHIKNENRVWFQIILQNYFDWTNYSSIVEDNFVLQKIGQVLYSTYSFPVIIAGMLLLLAMIGAIILTITPNKLLKKQDIYLQVSRNSQNSYFLIKK